MRNEIIKIRRPNTISLLNVPLCAFHSVPVFIKNPRPSIKKAGDKSQK